MRGRGRQVAESRRSPKTSMSSPPAPARRVCTAALGSMHDAVAGRKRVGLAVLPAQGPRPRARRRSPRRLRARVPEWRSAAGRSRPGAHRPCACRPRVRDCATSRGCGRQRAHALRPPAGSRSPSRGDAISAVRSAIVGDRPVELPIPHLEGMTHRDLQARGVRFHVAEAGSGAPVLLLHGWPQALVLLAEDHPAAGGERRLICPDLRGFGWSEAPPGAYDKQTLADDMLALSRRPRARARRSHRPRLGSVGRLSDVPRARRALRALPGPQHDHAVGVAAVLDRRAGPVARVVPGGDRHAVASDVC